MSNKFPKSKQKIDEIFDKENKDAYELILCKCFDCCAYNPKEWSKLTNDDFKEAVDNIKNCTSTGCVLRGVATGETEIYTKKRTINLSEEEREKRRQRMLNLKSSKNESNS